MKSAICAIGSNNGAGTRAAAFHDQLVNAPKWDAPDLKKIQAVMHVVEGVTDVTPGGGPLDAPRMAAWLPEAVAA